MTFNTNDVLRELIREQVKGFLKEEKGMTQEEKDFEELLNTVQPGGSLRKSEIYKKLATYTQKYYGDDPVVKLFPPGTVIENWKELTAQEKSLRGTGERVEATLVEYAKSKGVDANYIGGKGHDADIAGRSVEVKSSEKAEPQMQLQTTFFSNDPKKFYALATNTSSENLTVSVISSKLLYRLALGKEIEKQLEDLQDSDSLKKAVQEGLQRVNLNKIIYETLKTGRANEDIKSFKLGNGVRVRFIVQLAYEPGTETRAEKASRTKKP